MTDDSDSDRRTRESKSTERDTSAQLQSRREQPAEPSQNSGFNRKSGRAGRSTGRMGRRRSFAPIEQVLDQVVNRLGLDRRLKEHTLLSLWPVLAGEPFASRSRALFLDFEGNVVVAVKDASVGQELSLHRTEMLRKLNFAAKSMGLSVQGLRFDLKRYHEKKEQELFAQARSIPEPKPEPSPDQLAALSLSESESSQVQELAEQLRRDEHSDDRLIGRIVSMFEQELKLRVWREAQGFARCSLCRLAVQNLHSDERLCAQCYFEKQSAQGKLGRQR